MLFEMKKGKSFYFAKLDDRMAQAINNFGDSVKIFDGYIFIRSISFPYFCQILQRTCKNYAILEEV